MSKTRKVFGFVGLVLAMFMGALDATIVNIALPDIMKHLNSSLQIRAGFQRFMFWKWPLLLLQLLSSLICMVVD